MFDTLANRQKEGRGFPGFRHSYHEVTDVYRQGPADRSAPGREVEMCHLQRTVKAIVRPGDAWGFVGECVEVEVVTQGATLDETIRNLQEAVALHIEDDLRPHVYGQRRRDRRRTAARTLSGRWSLHTGLTPARTRVTLSPGCRSTASRSF